MDVFSLAQPRGELEDKGRPRIFAAKSKYHRFAATFPYDPRKVGFIKNVIQGTLTWKEISFEDYKGEYRWVFSLAEIVDLLSSQFPEFKVEDEVIEILKGEKKWKAEEGQRVSAVDAVKQKNETSFNPKNIKAKLYDYQKIGVEFLMAANGRALIADEPGCGKTIQALSYVSHMNFGRVLIVCPATVKSVWEGEISKWTPHTAETINGQTKLSRIKHDTRFWIINYDILKKHLPELLKIHFDLIICDESHLIKNISTQRTKSVRQLSRNVPRIVFLTGTPLLSRPAEMFTMLNMLDPKTWSDWYQYTRRYCGGRDTYFGYDASGSTNIEELSGRIKSYYIRRRKEDILKELPPKIVQHIEIDLAKESRAEYDKAELSIARFLREDRGKQPVEIRRALAAEKLTLMANLRQIISTGKLAAATEIIDSVIESGQKIIVFSDFHSTLDTLASKYKDKAVMITGRTSNSERGGIVKKFQEDQGTSVFLGGIKSAGVGITLTAASHVLFIDYTWNPADHRQAEDRPHRVGVKHSSINIYYLCGKGTIDTKSRQRLTSKQKVFGKVFDEDILGFSEPTDVSPAIAGMMEYIKSLH